MRLLEFFPSAELAPFVSKFVYLESNLYAFGFRAVPRNYPAIIITAPESTSWGIRIDGKDHQLGGRHGAAVYFAGMGFSPSEMKFNNHVSVWILMLQPQTAGLFFGDTAKAFINNVYEVTDTHLQWRFFAEQLWDTPLHFNTSVQLIEQFIARFLKTPKITPGLLIALEQIHRSSGMLSIKEIAEKAYTCNRNLLRQFDDYIGVNPKTYSAMIRFSKLINELILHPATNIEELAFRYAYYDLSHLNKDALRFLNIPLSEMRHQTKSLIPHMI